MAWVIGGKHFGQYTYEHWFDDDFEEPKIDEDSTQDKKRPESTENFNDSIIPNKPQR